jgi:hypothetical protein
MGRVSLNQELDLSTGDEKWIFWGTGRLSGRIQCGIRWGARKGKIKRGEIMRVR